MNFYNEGGRGGVKSSLHLLITIKPAIKYFHFILDFIFYFDDSFNNKKKSMKHSMTLNRTAVSSNLICDLCFFSLRIATSLELLDDES